MFKAKKTAQSSSPAKAKKKASIDAKFTLLNSKSPKSSLDPLVSSLFASSPTKPLVKRSDSENSTRTTVSRYPGAQAKNAEDLASSDDGEGEAPVDSNAVDLDVNFPQAQADDDESARLPRKRKRGKENEGLESDYLAKLAKEEAREDALRRAERKAKRQRPDDEAEVDQKPATVDEAEDDDEEFVIPQHESLTAASSSTDQEKAARTVFLGNVSSTAITSKTDRKNLLSHLVSFVPSLPEHEPAHKIESYRFRSTAYATAVPKKAAFARQELMEATTKSTNAYVVYTTKVAAREAAKQLNGTIVLDRHLRVDEVAHPAKTDHRRCVFVGNLSYVDDDSAIRAAEAAERGGKPRKSQPGDLEEGLWRQFATAGRVESVRVVRDSKTRISKGFAYVQFADQNGVEAALLFNDKRFPPLLPRKLRVTRAKRPSTTGAGGKPLGPTAPKPNERTFHGRAGKLFGRAGAAEARNPHRRSRRDMLDGKLKRQGIKPPEDFVFEGQRASRDQGNGLKVGKKRAGAGGRPKNRSANRAATWKSKSATPKKAA